LAISVELGLLPPDTKIETGKKRKRSLPAKMKDRRPKKKKVKMASSSRGASSSAEAKMSASKTEPQDDTKREDDDGDNSDDEEEEEEEEEEDEEEEINEPPPEPMDPEITLDCLRLKAMPRTVHWDPDSPDGQKIGWRVRLVISDSEWVDGRVVRYDPHTHKHKIELLPESNMTDSNLAAAAAAETASSNSSTSTGKSNRSVSSSIHASGASAGTKKHVWLWLRNEQHSLHLATRIVWAHVKGYAWWPAFVMESAVAEDRKEGYVRIEFFGTGEVSTLRDTSECIRPFSPEEIDSIVAKHKKKRNIKAFASACAEWKAVVQTRNAAAVFYAEKAINMANQRGGLNVIGKRVQIQRNDVIYPDVDTVVGTVRRYSTVQKKWLVSFEISTKTKNKYDAAWINLQSKKCALQILDKKKVQIKTEDLVPFVYGFEHDRDGVQGGDTDTDNAALGKLLTDCCRGCVEYWKKDETNKLACEECGAAYHFGCFDPPLSVETRIKMAKDGTPLICSRCTPCRGCYQKDIVFGSHLHVPPPTLLFPTGKSLCLCSMCKDAYEVEQFCPNCAHSWDDVKYTKVRRQIEWGGSKGRKRKTGIEAFEDSAVPVTFGSFSGEEALPLGAKVDPTWYYPETSEWGYTEVDMLVCDGCNIWVHAGCSGISEDDYITTSDGDHPIYSKEFLCRICCKQRCKDIIEALQKEDTSMLFAMPVTEKVAPNYSDVIKNPMDLQTMLEKTQSEDYLNYAWVRELFELMVLNALTFNRHVSEMYTRWAATMRTSSHTTPSIHSISQSER
jgi:hypothetical protein